jgi:hypothetical protein
MPTTTPKAWTFMVYNNYDDATIGAMHGDIAERMADVGSTEEVDLVVLCDDKPEECGGDPGFGSPLFHIPAKGSKKPLSNHPDWDNRERNLGDPQTLIDFVRFAKEHFPAQRYALVIAGHGCGWMPAAYDEPRVQQHLEKLKRVLTATAEASRSSTKTPIQLTISPDLTSRAEISALQLADALAEIATTLEAPLDVLAFDACFMQMAEIAFQIGDSARYQVGPEWYGLPWDYSDLCQRLVGQPEAGPEAVARIIVDAYQAAHPYTPRYTMSALNLAQLGTTRDRITALADAYLAAPLDPDELDELLTEVLTLDDAHSYRDLGMLAQRLSETGSQALREAATALCDHLHQQLVIRNASAGLEGASGLSITAPLPQILGEQEQQLYEELTMSQSTPWDDLLDSLARARQGTEESPSSA